MFGLGKIGRSLVNVAMHAIPGVREVNMGLRVMGMVASGGKNLSLNSIFTPPINGNAFGQGINALM